MRPRRPRGTSGPTALLVLAASLAAGNCRHTPPDTASPPDTGTGDTADSAPETGDPSGETGGTGGTGETGTPSTCASPPETGAGDQVFRVATEAFPAGVGLGLVFDDGGGLLPDGYGVVVVVPGSFTTNHVPVVAPELAEDWGFIQVYVNFPGGTGAGSTAGEDDLRGPSARAALVVATRYAAGLLRDMDGCTLAERSGLPISSVAPVLHGQSNGGNLVVETLADPVADLPPLSGITTFESPVSAQVVTEEVGSQRFPQPLYVPNTCTWTAPDGLTCPLDYTSVRWDPTLEVPGEPRGAVYFDLDGDGAWTDGIDHPVFGERYPVGTERIAFSPPLAAALQAAGTWDDRFLLPAEASDFWLDRDASRVVVPAVTRWPGLPVLVTGTTRDHASDTSDHPHVTGLASAWMAAAEGVGAAPWVRVNPDAVYLEAVSGARHAWTDHPASMSVVPGDLRVAMEPDEVETGVPRYLYTTAGVVEILERAWAGDWSANLSARLGGAGVR